MENKFLANNVIFIYMTILIVLPVVIAIGLLCFQYWLESLFPFGITLIFTIITLIFRKYFFNQILLNDKGISVVYHKCVLKHLDWTEIKTIKLTHNNLFILANFETDNDNEFAQHPNDYICFDANKKHCQIFAQYYKLINTTLQNPEKLGNLKDLFIK